MVVRSGRRRSLTAACALVLSVCGLGPWRCQRPVDAVGATYLPEVFLMLDRRQSIALWFSSAASVVNPLHALADTLPATIGGADFKTLKQPPRIPQETAVTLLSTVIEAALDWGTYSAPGSYQGAFARQRSSGFQGFRSRYANYDLSGLLNTTLIAERDPRTIRFYFAYLNEVQFKTIGQTITSKSNRARFTRVVGGRLYKKILKGNVIGPRTIGDDPKTAEVNMSSSFAGIWPPMKPPPPPGNSVEDIAEGTRRLLEYLRQVGYCEKFELSDFRPLKDGAIEFISFVKEPVNIEATTTLMKIDDFLPRFDSRILEAYFNSRQYECDFKDKLADTLFSEKSEKDSKDSSKGIALSPRGVRTKWTLFPDPDAGL